MKKLLFIINPMAGRQQAQTDLYKMVKIFADHDYEVTVYPTRARLDCTRKVLEDADRFDLVVCCGGDGTLNEMVSGMMQRQDRRPMGYIPLGSTNDLAVSLRLPTRVEEAALRALRSKLQLSEAATPKDALYWLRELYNLNDYTDTDVLDRLRSRNKIEGLSDAEALDWLRNFRKTPDATDEELLSSLRTQYLSLIHISEPTRH